VRRVMAATYSTKSCMSTKLRLARDRSRVVEFARATLLVTILCCSSAQGTDVNYLQVGRWQIMYRAGEHFNECDAWVRHLDRTYISLTMMQYENADKIWLLFLYNPAWDIWIKESTQHALHIFADKKHRLEYAYVTNDGDLYIPHLSLGFVKDVAYANFLRISRDGKSALTHLNMKDSAAAVGAVTNCIKEHPINETPSPATRVGERSLARQTASNFACNAPYSSRSRRGQVTSASPTPEY
jgi:hypothetical protein